MSPDLINGLFEIFGAVFMLPDIRRIARDKTIKGIWWPGRIYFLSWGVWNLYFYPYYGHTWSFIGGIAIAAVNLIWILMVIYYEYIRPNYTADIR